MLQLACSYTRMLWLCPTHLETDWKGNKLSIHQQESSDEEVEVKPAAKPAGKPAPKAAAKEESSEEESDEEESSDEEDEPAKPATKPAATSANGKAPMEVDEESSEEVRRSLCPFHCLLAATLNVYASSQCIV